MSRYAENTNCIEIFHSSESSRRATVKFKLHDFFTSRYVVERQRATERRI